MNNAQNNYIKHWEVKLFNALNERKIKVIRQYYDGHKHIDLYLPEAQLAIEVDGLHHYKDADQIISDLEREHYSDVNEQVNTLHIPNVYITKHLNEIANAIEKAVKKIKNNETDFVYPEGQSQQKS